MSRLLPLWGLVGCVAAKEAAVRDAMDQIWNQGDLSVVDAAYEPELAHEIKRFVVENRDLYPDIHVEILDSVIRGNRYVTRWAVSGTHRDLGRKVTLEGVSVRRREGGVFVEEHLVYDLKQVYDQLGFKVIPPAGVSPFEQVTVAAGEAVAGVQGWPADVPESHREAAVKAVLDASAASAGGAMEALDCASYPCVALITVPAAAVGSVGKALAHAGYTLPWLWPVVDATGAHLAVGLPVGALEPSEASALTGRMLPYVGRYAQVAGLTPAATP